jgi:hypothetical protein
MLGKKNRNYVETQKYNTRKDTTDSKTINNSAIFKLKIPPPKFLVGIGNNMRRNSRDRHSKSIRGFKDGKELKVIHEKKEKNESFKSKTCYKGVNEKSRERYHIWTKGRNDGDIDDNTGKEMDEKDSFKKKNRSEFDSKNVNLENFNTPIMIYKEFDSAKGVKPSVLVPDQIPSPISSFFSSKNGVDDNHENIISPINLNVDNDDTLQVRSTPSYMSKITTINFQGEGEDNSSIISSQFNSSHGDGVGILSLTKGNSGIFTENEQKISPGYFSDNNIANSKNIETQSISMITTLQENKKFDIHLKEQDSNIGLNSVSNITTPIQRENPNFQVELGIDSDIELYSSIDLVNGLLKEIRPGLEIYAQCDEGSFICVDFRFDF